MRIVRSTILALIISLALFSNLVAQGSFNIHGGAAIPLNNFSFYQLNYDKASATLGWNIGLQYSYRFVNKNFGVFGGIDYIHNGVSKEFKETVEYWDSLRESLFYDTIGQPTFPTYTNIPLTIGTNYTYELNDNVKLSCDIGLSINFLIISDIKSYHFDIKTDLAHGFGGCLGINMILQDRYSFNVNYKGLGKHTVDAYDMSGVEVEEFSQDISIHLLTLTLGLTF